MNNSEFTIFKVEDHDLYWTEAYSVPGGIFIGETNLSENEYSRITIKDNGIGFNQEYSDRIFEVFQRLNSKDDFEGTGIGLAIVKKIVQIHNGVIIATGELNNGAQFDFYIPYSVDDLIVEETLS